MRARRRTACLGPSTKEADMPGGTRRIALLVTLAAFFVPSALASTHTLTKAQVIKRGTVICKTAARRVEATPAPRSQNPFGKTAPEGDRARTLKFIVICASSLESVRVGLRSSTHRLRAASC
jgi:hypothetical protein